MLINVHDYEQLALEKLAVPVRDYYRSGSEDEVLRTIGSSAFLSLFAEALGYREKVYFSGYGTRHGVAFLMLNGLWKFAKKKDPLARV